MAPPMSKEPSSVNATVTTADPELTRCCGSTIPTKPDGPNEGPYTELTHRLSSSSKRGRIGYVPTPVSFKTGVGDPLAVRSCDRSFSIPPLKEAIHRSPRESNARPLGLGSEVPSEVMMTSGSSGPPADCWSSEYRKAGVSARARSPGALPRRWLRLLAGAGRTRSLCCYPTP